MPCERKCGVSQVTLLMMQGAHAVLNVLKFNNSMSKHTLILSLSEGAFSEQYRKDVAVRGS